MNYTVNFVLKKEKVTPSGLIPVYLKITINRKTAYMATGHAVPEKNWNAKTQIIREANVNSKTINPELAHRKWEVIKKIVELQVAGKPISAQIIKAHFSGKDLNNIFDFIENYCLEVKHKKDDQTIEVYERHARKLKAFNGSKILHFEEIDVGFLTKYEKHLRDEGASNNYVHAIWKTLKTFFNAARKKKLVDHYPFDEYENPIYKDPQKDYLRLAELEKWEEFADTATNNVLKQSAIWFLFGCYSGLRISDWFRFKYDEHVEDGMLKLRAKKNGEWVAIPINGPLARNLERMKTLPLSIEEPTINEKLKIIAKALEINKKLSSHCGRKTFAVTMCADQGISSETCAELMGITVDVCVRNYYVVTAAKIKKEVLSAWSGL